MNIVVVIAITIIIFDHTCPINRGLWDLCYVVLYKSTRAVTIDAL